MGQSAIRRSRSTVAAVLQTSAENFFIFAFLLLKLHSLPVTVILADF
jgi:hypothetical protein